MVGIGVEGGGVCAGGANSYIVDAVVALGLVINLNWGCFIKGLKILERADAV